MILKWIKYKLNFVNGKHISISKSKKLKISKIEPYINFNDSKMIKSN